MMRSNNRRSNTNHNNNNAAIDVGVVDDIVSIYSNNNNNNNNNEYLYRDNNNDDDSSSNDIRTVRTNMTNMFSVSTKNTMNSDDNENNTSSSIRSYYTNPTLLPTDSIASRIEFSTNPKEENRHRYYNSNTYDDDQTTLTDDNISTNYGITTATTTNNQNNHHSNHHYNQNNDYTSPTSTTTMMITNYDSYSKFGAAPIFHPYPTNTTTTTTTSSTTTGNSTSVQPSSSSSIKNQNQHHHNSNDIGLNTIHEDVDAVIDKEGSTGMQQQQQYYPPSYYRKLRRNNYNNNNSGSAGKSSHRTSPTTTAPVISTLKGTTRTGTTTTATVVSNGDGSSNSNSSSGNSFESKNSTTSTATNTNSSSNTDIAISNKKGSTGMINTGNNSKSVTTKPILTIPTKTKQQQQSNDTVGQQVAVIPSLVEDESLAVTKKSSSSSSLSLQPKSNSSAFSSMLNKMTTRNSSSPNSSRNNSRSASPIPPQQHRSSSSSSPVTIPNHEIIKKVEHDDVNQHKLIKDHVHEGKPTTTTTSSKRSNLRNYITTMAYKTRRSPSPSSHTSATTNTDTNPISVQQSTTNTTGTSLSSSVGGRITPPPISTPILLSPTSTPKSKSTQHHHIVPISPSSCTSNNGNNGCNIPINTQHVVPNVISPIHNIVDDGIRTPIKNNTKLNSTNDLLSAVVTVVSNSETDDTNRHDHNKSMNQQNLDTTTMIAIPTLKTSSLSSSTSKTQILSSSTITTGSSSTSTTSPIHPDSLSIHTSPTYSNPNLKSISSKLFVNNMDDETNNNINNSDFDRTGKNIVLPSSGSRLNLNLIDNDERDHIKNTMVTSSDVEDDILTMTDLSSITNNYNSNNMNKNIPQESNFRLWTDEDSAFGTSWYSFTTSPFGQSMGTSNEPLNDIQHLESKDHAKNAGVTPVNMVAPPMIGPQLNVAQKSTIPSNVSQPAGGKLSLSSLQLLNFNHAPRGGNSTITSDDDNDTPSKYPSMVSSEFEDEGGNESTISGTLGDNTYTDDYTLLDGGPSFDFSVSACLDDESLKKADPKGVLSSNLPPTNNASKSNPPIVYSNVGQALSRGDMRMSKSLNVVSKPIAPRLLQPSSSLSDLDRPQRRRTLSSGKVVQSSPPLEKINEHDVHDHKLIIESSSSSTDLNATADMNNATAADTMVVVSLVGSASSSQSSISKRSPNQTNISNPSTDERKGPMETVRKLDCIQIGIILLIAIALAAVFCATFCIVGSCQVGKKSNNNDASNRILHDTISKSSIITAQPNYLRTQKSTDEANHSMAATFIP